MQGRECELACAKCRGQEYVELYLHGMTEGLYFYLLSNNTLINNTSIQKVPGSNLCNRSVKYIPDHLCVS